MPQKQHLEGWEVRGFQLLGDDFFESPWKKSDFFQHIDDCQFCRTRLMTEDKNEFIHYLLDRVRVAVQDDSIIDNSNGKVDEITDMFKEVIENLDRFDFEEFKTIYKDVLEKPKSPILKVNLWVVVREKLEEIEKLEREELNGNSEQNNG